MLLNLVFVRKMKMVSCLWGLKCKIPNVKYDYMKNSVPEHFMKCKISNEKR